MIFKKIVKRNNFKDWDDITLDQFNKILGFIEQQDEYTDLNILDTIYPDENIADLSLEDFKKYKGSLDFLNKDISNVQLKKYYNINGRTYDSNFDLTVVNVAQFIDYSKYVQNGKPKYEDILSVFFIPKGHKYNDGYDLHQVKEDIKKLNIRVVKTAAFFFEIQLLEFLNLFQHYFQESIEKMKLPEEEKKKILDKIQETDFLSLV